MQLSEQTINYIKSTSIPCTIKSNFLITDLEKVIYSAAIEEENNNYYITKPLSNDLLSLLDKWNALPISEDLRLLENKPKLNIIEGDTEFYDSIMIFPIYLNDKIERTCNIF